MIERANAIAAFALDAVVGAGVVVDEAYLRESIVDPNAKIVAGFPAGAMPPYNYLSEQQIADLIAYFKALQ